MAPPLPECLITNLVERLKNNFLSLIVVERPITWPTPHRSARAELPHPALQLYIHSCKHTRDKYATHDKCKQDKLLWVV